MTSSRRAAGHSAVSRSPETKVIYVFGGRGYHQLSSELFRIRVANGVGDASERLRHRASPAIESRCRARYGAAADASLRAVAATTTCTMTFTRWISAPALVRGRGSCRQDPAPAPREGHVARVSIPSHNRMIVFGGRGFSRSVRGRLGAELFPRARTACGLLCPPAGLIPAPRTEAAVAFRRADATDVRGVEAKVTRASSATWPCSILTTVQGVLESSIARADRAR